MDSEFKVGPQKATGFVSGVIEAIKDHLVILLVVPVVLPAILMNERLRGSSISFGELLENRYVVACVVMFLSVWGAIVVYRALAYYIDTWFRFGPNELVVFRKQHPERISLRIPYKYVTVLAISERGPIFVRYKKDGVGILGKDSLVRLGKKTTLEQDRIIRMFEERCPQVRMRRFSKWGNPLPDSRAHDNNRHGI